MDIAVNVSKIGFELCKSLNRKINDFEFFIEFETPKIETVKTVEIKSYIQPNQTNVNNLTNQSNVNYYLFIAYTFFIIIATWKISDWFKKNISIQLVDNCKKIIEDFVPLAKKALEIEENAKKLVFILRDQSMSFRNNLSSLKIIDQQSKNIDVFFKKINEISLKMDNYSKKERDIDYKDIKTAFLRKKESFWQIASLNNHRIIFIPALTLIGAFIFNDIISQDANVDLFLNFIHINDSYFSDRVNKVNEIFNKDSWTSFEWTGGIELIEGRYKCKNVEKHLTNILKCV